MNHRTFPQLCRTVQDNLFKVIVIGDTAVGKTAIIKQSCLGRFNSQYGATIGVDFMTKQIIRDNVTYRLQLWDIAGQERFGQMTRIYYKNTIGAIIVFDLTRPDTFFSVEKWKMDLDSKQVLPDGSSLPCILLANKSDEYKKNGIRIIPHDLELYAKEKGYVGAAKTSAKNNSNIEDALNMLVDGIIRKKYLYPYYGDIQVDEPFTLTQKNKFVTFKNNEKLKSKNKKCNICT